MIAQLGIAETIANINRAWLFAFQYRNNKNQEKVNELVNKCMEKVYYPITKQESEAINELIANLNQVATDDSMQPDYLFEIFRSKPLVYIFIRALKEFLVNHKINESAA